MAIKNRVGKAVADDLDFKFDFDSYEDQFPDSWDTVSEDYTKAESSRSPITKARNNVIAGLKDGLMNRTGMEQVLKSAFPSEYGETYDNLTSVLSGVSESSDLVKKEFNRLKSRGKAYLRQLAPVGDMVGLRKLTDKLNDWGKEDYDNDTYGQSNTDKQREREDSIQASLGELFSIQNRMAEHRSKIAEAKENQKEAIETVRFQGQIKALASIDSSLRNQVSFQNKNTFNYYRKSIEIQLRKYHLLSDIYNTQTRTSEALIQTLNEIKLNTGLPEFVKMRNSEAAKEMLRSKAIEGMHKGIFGNGDFITKLTENLVGSVRNAIGSFTDFTDLLDPMVEQGISAIVDDDPLGRDALHSGVANVSPTLFGFLGKKILEKSYKTKFGRKVYKNAQRLKSFNDNLGENVLSAFKSGKIHQFGRKFDKNGELVDPIVDFMQQLVYQSVNQRQTTQLDIEGYENYGDQLGRDQLSSKAQRVVIPGYLARILRELTIIRTGQDAPLLEYNYRTNKFASSDSLTKDILKSAVGQKNVQSIRNLGTSALQTAGMFQTNKLTGKRELMDGFTNSDMLAIGNVLVNAASNNIAVDARFLSNPNSFKEAIGPEKAEILAARYRKISHEDKKENKQNRVRGFFGYEKDRLGSLGGSAKNVLKSMGIPENTLQAIINAGHGGKLRQIGLIDGMGNVNTDKLIELSQSINSYEDFLEVVGIDEEVGSLKIKRSKGMKGPRGTSSYQVGNKVIIPGITPNRQVDMVSSQQGLASYLADSNDTPYLEIISHQLSSLNETLSGSTGYVPEPRESAFSSGVSKAFAWTKKFSSKWYGKASDRFHQEWEGARGDYIRDKAHELNVRGKLAKRKLSRKATTAINKIKAKGKELEDLYHSDYEEPILKARDFITGKYRDAEGKVIESISDIKGHVFDEEGNIIVTREDLANAFYYDPKGRILESKHIKSLKDKYHDQKDRAKSKWSKTKEGFKSRKEEYSSKFRSFLNTAKSDLMGFSRNLNLPEPMGEQDQYLHTIARNTASTNDLLMEMSLKLENMQMMAINQFAMGNNLPDELRPRFMQRVKNLFNRKRTFQMPNQQKHIAQRIWEFGGWLGSSSATMGMALTRAIGNTVGRGARAGLSSFSSLAGLGFDMSADFIGSLKGKAKTTSNRAIDLAEANRNKVLDVFRKGDKEPILKANDMKKGKYYDDKGNPVIQFVDVKTDIFDKDGNLVCTYDEFKNGYVKDGGTYKVIKALNWFKDYTSGLTARLGEWDFKGLALPIKAIQFTGEALHGVMRRKLRMQIKDIYVKGFPEEPVIFARDLRAGKYFDKETGKPVFDIVDISGPVVDKEGNEVLTREDLRMGLVDSRGKEFTDHYRNFSGTKQWLIAKTAGIGLEVAKGMTKLGIAGVRMGVNMGKTMYNSAKQFLGLGLKTGAKGLRMMGGAYNSIYDKLTGKIKDPSDALFAGLSMTNETNQYLFAIHSLLDQRIPLPNSKVFGDSDGDGLRENGIADIRQKNRLSKLRAAEEKATQKRDERLAKMIGDNIRGKNKTKEDEKEEDGIFENLIEGLTEGIGMKLLSALGLGSLFGGSGDSVPGDMAKGTTKGKPRSRAARMRQVMARKFKRSGLFSKGRNMLAAGSTAASGMLGRFTSPITSKIGGVVNTAGGILSTGASIAGTVGSKAMSFAGKAIPIAGGLYAGYSGIQNLTEGNYGMAALDLGLASASIFGTGATMSALGAAGGLLAAALPYALIAGGVALAGYGVYRGARKLYDMYKGSKVGDLEKARLMLYGFDHDSDDSWSSKILKFERIVMDAVVVGPNGLTIDPRKIDPSDAYDIFGFEESDQVQSQKWMIWFNKRFIPGFTKALKVLKEIDQKYTIEDSYNLEGEKASRYLNAIKPAPGEYTEMYSPFKDLEMLKVSGSEALVFIDKVLKKVSNGESLQNPGFLKKAATAAMKVAVLPFKAAEAIGTGIRNAIKWTGSKLFKAADAVLGNKFMGATPIGSIWSGIKNLFGLKGSVIATNGEGTSVGEGRYDPFLSIKYKAYGLKDLSDTTRIAILNQLEQVVANDITWNGNTASYSKDISELVKETYSLFGINENDKSGLEILGKYLRYRFLPIFVNLITALNKHLNTTDLNRITKARPAIKMLIVNDIVNIPVDIDGVRSTTWTFSLSPFGNVLNTNKSSIDGDVDKLKKDVDSKGQSDAKIKAEEAANESKSLGDRIKDFGKTLLKSTPMGMMLDKLLPNSIKEAGSNLINDIGNATSNLWEAGKEYVTQGVTGKISASKEKYRDAIWAEMAKNGITSKNEVAAFLSQVATETGNLKWLEELASGAAYEGRRDLGNTQPGDGRRFKGRGLIQLTGRANYERFAKYIGRPEIMQNPQLVSQDPTLAVQSAIFYWNTRKGLREAAQRGDIDKVSRLVNGGTNGLKERRENFSSYLNGKGPLWKAEAAVNIGKAGMTTRSDWNNQAGVNTRADWDKMNQSPTSAPSKEYLDKMNSFGQARKYIMNSKTLTDSQRKQALLKINNEAHAYMTKYNNADQQGPYTAGYDHGSKPNVGSNVNAKTKPGIVAAWCTKNGPTVHTILGKKKGGNCAATVGLGLYHAGYIKTSRGNGHARDYGKKLLGLGWKDVTGSPWQVGDIAVCFPNPRASWPNAREYGHVSVFNGREWWADIKSQSPCPYKDRDTAGYNVRVYRDPNYLNGGTAIDDVSSRGGFANSVTSTYSGNTQQTRPIYSTTVNGKVTKEQIEKGKQLASFGLTSDGISAASKLYNYTTPEQEAAQYNYDTSNSGNNLNGIAGLSGLEDKPNDSLGKLQASVRKLLGIGKIDASSVNAALDSTKEKRKEMQEEQKGTNILSMVLDKAKRNVISTTEKNNLKESTSASIEQSKSMKNDIVSVSNEILKENQQQTKLLTDILDALRKEKSKSRKENSGFTPQERVSFRDSINGSSDLGNPRTTSKTVIDMRKQPV